MIFYKAKSKKLYVYVDESGQDTKGLIFVVGILVFEKEKSALMEKLGKIEKKSGKNNVKWNKCKYEFRKDYIEKIGSADIFRDKLFFEVFSDTKKYIELTSYATAKAILKKASDNYKATVFVDGLKKKEIAIFVRGLRALRIRTKKIRGVKKDENNAFIRLVDALCGLVRDANDGQKWASETVLKLKHRKIADEL
ncbi:MAG TPA: DUF3800 domain-containing protein [Candidatus Moranbacteria bacterium]|nr:DUF3800 domain-containing protein [Candidatus Moranbacteria bacterium]